MTNQVVSSQTAEVSNKSSEFNSLCKVSTLAMCSLVPRPCMFVTCMQHEMRARPGNEARSCGLGNKAMQCSVQSAILWLAKQNCSALLAYIHPQQCTFYICSVILLWEHYEDFLETAADLTQVKYKSNDFQMLCPNPLYKIVDSFRPCIHLVSEFQCTYSMHEQYSFVNRIVEFYSNHHSIQASQGECGFIPRPLLSSRLRYMYNTCVWHF